MRGRCYQPRRVLVAQVKAGGGGLWQELRDSSSLSCLYLATCCSQSGPAGQPWHCPACFQIRVIAALREGSTQTQSLCCRSAVPKHTYLYFWTRLCLIAILGERDLLASHTPWRFCGFISALLLLVL